MFVNNTPNPREQVVISEEIDSGEIMCNICTEPLFLMSYVPNLSTGCALSYQVQFSGSACGGDIYS